MSAFDQVVEAHEKAVALSQRSPFFVVSLAQGYASAGRREDAMGILDDLSAKWAPTYTSPYYMATAYAALDERDAAYEWLERAYEVHDSWLVFAKEDPLLDSLHLDLRYQGLLRRLNFPECPS